MNLLLQSGLNNENAPYIILGVGVLLIMYVVIRPYMKRKKDPMKPNFNRPSSLSQQRTVERQMESLLVELSEMTRQMTAQLDTRATKLELLIKEADEKIGRMEQLAQDQAMERHTSRFAEPVTAAAPMSTPLVEAPEPSPAPATSGIDARHVQIYTLADEGKSVSEIASAVGQPSGEIELILALRRS